MAKKPTKAPKLKTGLAYGRGPRINPGQVVTLESGQQIALDAENWIESGEWAGVNSSRVAGISYSKETRSLFVEFNPAPKQPISETVVCEYFNVPEETAKDMFNATSLGVFISQRLDGSFTYRKL